MNALLDERGVFYNKLGISDAAQLKAVEYSLTAKRWTEIESGLAPHQVPGFGLPRLQAIHGHLFKDVYDWAGQLRTTPSSKRAENGMTSVFAEPSDISPNWAKLAERTNEFATATNLTIGQKREQLTSIYIEANRIHPFPEGNGRSLQLFMKELGKEQGVELDFTRVKAQEWNLASALSGTHGRLFEHRYLIPQNPNSGPITKLLEQVVRPARAMAFEKLPEAEACARFPELRGAYAGLRTIENQVGQREGSSPEGVSSYMSHVREAFVKRLDQGESVGLLRQVQTRARDLDAQPPQAQQQNQQQPQPSQNTSPAPPRPGRER